MRPRELVQRWVDTFNRADVDARAAFYAEDGINHQVADSPVHGREAIRVMFAAGFAQTEMVCVREQIFEDREQPLLSSLPCQARLGEPTPGLRRV
jgi:ketosteroid isomerase-like protein